MHDRYTAAGGKARLVAYGRFGGDSHALFGARAGAPIWQPELSDFLRSIGMPHELQPAMAQFGLQSPLPAAARTAASPDDPTPPEAR